MKWNMTLTYWWNTPQYVANEVEECCREFRATLDVSDLTSKRVVPVWRYNVGGVIMAVLWLPLSLVLMSAALVVAILNGVTKSVLPFVVHHLRRVIVGVSVLGCPMKPAPEKKATRVPDIPWAKVGP